MIETSNLKHIKEKSKVLLTDYQFVSFDLLTYSISTLLLCVKQYTVKTNCFPQICPSE